MRKRFLVVGLLLSVVLCLGARFSDFLTGVFFDKGGQVFNVRAYGAIPDDSIDDTVAIAATIVAATTGQGGTLYFPGGVYLTTGVSIPAGNQLLILGAGMGRTVIIGSDPDDVVFTVGDTVTPTTRIVMRDLTIRGSGGVGTGAGLALYYLAESQFSGVEIDGHANDGLVLERVEHSSFINLRVYGNGRYGGNLKAIGVNPTNVNNFVGCRFNQNNYNIYIQGGEANNFAGCKFDTGTIGNVVLDSSPGNNAARNHFTGCHFEQTSGVELDYQGSSGQSIDGGSVTDSVFAGVGTYGIRLAYTNGVTIQGNRIQSGYTSASIQINSNCDGNRVLSNTVDTAFDIALASNTEQVGNWDKATTSWLGAKFVEYIYGDSDISPEANSLVLKNGRLVVMNDPNDPNTRAGHAIFQFDLTAPIDNTDMLFRKDAAIKIVGGGDQNRPAIIQLSQNNILGNTSGVGEIYFGSSRGATPTARAAVDNDDWLGVIRFFGDDGTDMNNSAAEIYVAVDETLESVGADIIPASIVLQTMKQGPILLRTNNTNRFKITGDGDVTINELGADVDVRIAGDTLPNLFLLDASVDRIFITDAATGGTPPTDPTGGFAVGTLLAVVNNSVDSDQAVFSLIAGAVGISAIHFGDADSAYSGGINYFHNTDRLALTAGLVNSMDVRATNVVVNDIGSDIDFWVEGDTNPNLFFVDAGTDRVGIGTATPSVLLELQNTAGPTPLWLTKYGPTGEPYIQGLTSRGTPGTPAATLVNDVLLMFTGIGRESVTAWATPASAWIVFAARENFGVGAHGGLIQMYVVDNGATDTTKVVEITADSTEFYSMMSAAKDGDLLPMDGTLLARTSTTTVTNTASQTDLTTKTLAGAPSLGRVYHISTAGDVKNDAADTTQYRVSFGGTVVCDTGTMATSATVKAYTFDTYVTVRVAGATATVQCDGTFHVDAVVGVGGSFPVHATTGSVDLSGTPILKTTATFAGASAPTTNDEINETSAAIRVLN